MSDTYGATPPLPNAQPTASPAGPGLADQWRSWIGDPGNRAALIQTGLALAQPVGLGQNTLGHVAGAIGQGGEASDRVSAEEARQREQLRKEDDTESKGIAREAQANTAAARADTASVRAQSEAAQVESRIKLRQQQALLAESRARQADTNIKLLEARITAFPADAQARIDLAAARAEKAQADTELSLSRAAVVGQDSDTRRQNADSRTLDTGSKVDTRGRNVDINQQNADTRRDIGGQRIEIGKERNRITDQGQGLGAAARTRGQYDKYVTDTKKENTNAKLVNPKASDTPILPFEEWKARTGTGAGTGFPPAPAPSPTPDARPAPGAGGAAAPQYYKVAPSEVSKYPEAKQAPDGNWYIQR